MLLELCASTMQSVLNAAATGVKRIELCSELAVGGITPSSGFIKETLASATLEVLVLIRPRSGDFKYTTAEFNCILSDIDHCKELGCHGIVSGVLHDDGTIDKERTAQLVARSYPLPFVFHRAFDHVPDPFKALEILKEIGVTRILTSGGASKAALGIERLKQLKKQAAGAIQIVPGGGINASNIGLFKDAGFEQVHASGTSLQTTTTLSRIPMNGTQSLVENCHLISTVDVIKDLLANSK